jgi:hypothetical protein
MSIKTTLTDKEIKSYFAEKPVQVNRATRLAINKITRLLNRDLGGTIPKKAGSSVAGFRRVRAKRSLATVKKARRNNGKLQSSVFMGTNDIFARYAGKPRQIGSNVKAGRHVFKNSFILELDNGFRGVFSTIRGKLEQQTFQVKGSEALAIRARNKYVSEDVLGKEVINNLKKELDK